MMVYSRKQKISETDDRSVDRDKIYERDQGICHICSQTVSRDNFHLDHIVPLYNGGTHVAANIKIAHRHCNIAKYTKSLSEYRNWNPRFDELIQDLKSKTSVLSWKYLNEDEQIQLFRINRIVLEYSDANRLCDYRIPYFIPELFREIHPNTIYESTERQLCYKFDIQRQSVYLLMLFSSRLIIEHLWIGIDIPDNMNIVNLEVNTTAKRLQIQSVVSQIVTDFATSDVQKLCPEVSRGMVTRVLNEMSKLEEIKKLPFGSDANNRRWIRKL